MEIAESSPFNINLLLMLWMKMVLQVIMIQFNRLKCAFKVIRLVFIFFFFFALYSTVWFIWAYAINASKLLRTSTIPISLGRYINNIHMCMSNKSFDHLFIGMENFLLKKRKKKNYWSKDDHVNWWNICWN